MKHSPSWEANLFSVSQEIPRFLWNPKAHCRFNKCPPSFPFLRQLDPVYGSIFHFLKIHFNITLPSTNWSSKRSLSLGFPHQNPVLPLLSTLCYIPSPSNSSRCDQLTILGEEYRSIEILRKLSENQHFHSPISYNVLILTGRLSIQNKLGHFRASLNLLIRFQR